MRALALGAVALLVSCSQPTVPTPRPASSIVVTATVPNGRVEVVVKSLYAIGETVRATVRLMPTSGTLSGPVDAFIQASGFHGTATVRRLTVNRVTATPAAASVVDVAWDMRDDAGTAVGSDDYSLVFNVVDDANRSTTIGATLQVR